jgi:hypothetical protein
VGDTPLGVAVHDIGYLRSSADGKKIAFANYTLKNVVVFPFDNTLGTVDPSQGLTIPVPTIPNHIMASYGVEFSATGRYLYYSVLGSGPLINPTQNNIPATNGYIFQHDLTATAASVQVGMHPNAGGRNAVGALQMGPDGRIYVALDGERQLGVIASPEGAGTACNLTFNFPLDPNSTCYCGFPNLISSLCGCGCKEGPCDEAVEDANRALNTLADQRSFVINAIGQAVPAGCSVAFERRDFAPVFSLHWGDGPSDQFESHDTEVIYIRIRNPYRNLVYRGVKVFNIRITPNQTLPDGEDALRLVPARIVCFDEIGPCAYVSRDFAFLIRNAIVQSYRIEFDYCIEETAIVATGDGTVAFRVNVVAS